MTLERQLRQVLCSPLTIATCVAVGATGNLAYWSGNSNASTKTTSNPTQQVIAASTSKPSSQVSDEQRKFLIETSPITDAMNGEQTAAFIGTYGLTPQWMLRRAFIRVIGRAEGTYIPDRPDYDPYRVIFGSTPNNQRKLDDFSKHPDRCYRIGAWGQWANQCSTAAGLGQWITTTWENVRKQHASAFWFPDGEFSPRNQDLAMIRHLDDIGATRRLMAAGRVDGDRVVIDEEKFADLVDHVANVWASFPCLKGTDQSGQLCTGTSYYGQGGKSVEEITRFMREELAKEMK